MSPTAFKDQQATLLTLLTSLYDLCQLIRTARHLGSSPTPNFDAFQSSTLSTKANLAYNFSSQRSASGSRFDLGDTIARTELDRAVRSLQSMQATLSNIAYGHERKPTGGFSTLYYQLQTLESEVLSTFSGLKYRLEVSSAEEKKPKPILKKTKTDEVVIGIKKLDAYTEHLKKSWMEMESDDGVLYYVNCWDEGRRVWEMPRNAFIRFLEKEKPKRRATWEKELERETQRERERAKERERERVKEREREERRRRADPWRNLDGW